VSLDLSRDPLTRQRSPWLPVADDDVVRLLRRYGCAEIAVLHRRVHDGELRAIRSCDPPEYSWHLSVSHHRTGLRAERRAPRYPTWDELADARYELLPSNIDVVMHLPPPDEYVSAERTTFHLHEHRPVASEAAAWRVGVDAHPSRGATTGAIDDPAPALPSGADS
jgi:hypothetical protein